MKTRRGFSFVEILVLIALSVVVIVAACQLSSQNNRDHADAAERLLAQGVALDTLERLKRYKVGWALPGTSDPNDPGGGTPIEEMYGALELREQYQNSIDRSLVAEMTALGMTALPKVERIEEPGEPGLFRLTVTMKWKGRRGTERETKFTRYCYAP